MPAKSRRAAGAPGIVAIFTIYLGSLRFVDLGKGKKDSLASHWRIIFRGNYMRNLFGLMLISLLFGTSFSPAIADESGNAPAAKTEKTAKDIGPYRRDVLKRIAQNWHPKQSNKSVTIEIKLDKSGKLLESKIVKSSGDKDEDKLVLDTLKTTEFSAPPDFAQDPLTFKIDLNKTPKN